MIWAQHLTIRLGRIPKSEDKIAKQNQKNMTYSSLITISADGSINRIKYEEWNWNACAVIESTISSFYT